MKGEQGMGDSNSANGKRASSGKARKRRMDVVKDEVRRASPRLQNIPDHKKPYYGSSERKPLQGFLEKYRDNVLRKLKEDKNSGAVNKRTVPVERSGIEIIDLEDEGLEGASYFSPVVDKIGIGTFLKLREIMRLLNLQNLSQAKDEKCGDVEVLDLQIVDSSQFNISEEGKSLNPGKEYVPYPDVEVGRKFLTRDQISSSGFHDHWLFGNDHKRKPKIKVEPNSHTFPMAKTMLLCGPSEDVDDLLEVVYSSQCGDELDFDRTQIDDQVMQLGNTAIKNNMDHHISVQVIRRRDCANSGKRYTFDGLFQVVKCCCDKDASKFTVFKYQLKKLQSQPKSALRDQVHSIRGKVSNILYPLPGLVCKDISNGLENIYIPATNVVDDPPVAPSGFTYMNRVEIAPNVAMPPNSKGCKCKGNCTKRRPCSCAKRNGLDYPYVRQDGGRLTEAKDIVFECGPECGCGPACINRLSQRGLKYQLEVYRTRDKGWAVRSLDFIPSGAPVCEYCGILRRTDELEDVSGNDFIFEIDCWQTIKGIGVRERRMTTVQLPTTDSAVMTNGDESDNAPEFCIDAGQYGNVSRFINHSCEPNLFVQCVLSSHLDVRLARVVLFAADDIPPMQELTYDYGYELDSVIGPDGKIKEMTCSCGTADCRKRLY